jgi:exonuclease III
MKIVSWNVNGLRAWVKNKCMSSLVGESADVYCLPEGQVPERPAALRNFDSQRLLQVLQQPHRQEGLRGGRYTGLQTEAPQRSLWYREG